MNETITVDEPKFFAPVATDLIDSLLGQYQAMRGKVERVASVLNSPDMDGALHYFSEYAGSKDHRLNAGTVSTMFDLTGAIAHLNAAYWSKAMHLTDVLDAMPQARRDAWHNQIRHPLGLKKDRCAKAYDVEPIPEFNSENARGTLLALLSQRETFFAERVDGIFRSLSRTHVTNAPQGFGMRMILAGAINSYGTPEHRVCGVINDLRCVIAKFMGRDEPSHNASFSVVQHARHRRGEWIPVDGGALRIRCYMVGTAHLEVHPDMAWRLNCILAKLYPLAIPSNFREQPKKKVKDFVMMGRPLPFKVLEALSGIKQARDRNSANNWHNDTYVTVHGCYDLHITSETGRALKKEVFSILEALGGAQLNEYRWQFDYCPLETIQEVVSSGCIPDQKSHQFYPTPERLARIAVDFAMEGSTSDMRWMEPSAGMGGLADLMPKERTTCIEISPIHCTVLKSKGYEVVPVDFLQYLPGDCLTNDRYNRIVMNPPFSDGRWQAHTEHAARILADGGRLVAILPASAKGKDFDGMRCEWHGPYENEFAGTSAAVCILVADKEKT